jgi:hypothetical protein
MYIVAVAPAVILKDVSDLVSTIVVSFANVVEAEAL